MLATLRQLFRPSRRMMFASLLFAAACSGSNAYADQPATGPAQPPAHIALDIAPAKVRAPYDVQILRENGEALPTFSQRDRFYVQGNANERYTIRITNPTERRIEAVVSVDGLDVIDGENGDLRKRGYVVPPFGETRIDGFRTSQDDVATFRFSSVAGSYAGQKGKARNVGVIAVALFEEQAAPTEQIIIGDTVPNTRRRPYDYRDDLDARADKAEAAPAKRGFDGAGHAQGGYGAATDSRPMAKKRAAAAEPPAPTTAAAPSASRPAPASPPTGGAARYVPPSDNYRESDDDEVAPPPAARAQHERLGLGTEFGEQRTSSASYTRFVRAPGQPVAIAELRYNDTAGLMALGIPVQPLPDEGEIMTRETADPFPGDRFAQPPR
ncbi:MAG TPA: hypothetical protein VH165_20030 [Kofleriaceae bacterium]|jgi:hypothetical protein|nr:hypothetical protein [Kofleriaceae bacterium]